jgi:hypothetical protein
MKTFGAILFEVVDCLLRFDRESTVVEPMGDVATCEEDRSAKSAVVTSANILMAKQM